MMTWWCFRPSVFLLKSNHLLTIFIIFFLKSMGPPSLAHIMLAKHGRHAAKGKGGKGGGEGGEEGKEEGGGGGGGRAGNFGQTIIAEMLKRMMEVLQSTMWVQQCTVCSAAAKHKLQSTLCVCAAKHRVCVCVARHGVGMLQSIVFAAAKHCVLVQNTACAAKHLDSVQSTFAALCLPCFVACPTHFAACQPCFYASDKH